jgi:hypothetical protein
MNTPRPAAREARGHGHAGLAVVLAGGRGREADRAGGHGFQDDGAHLGDLGFGRGALGRGRPHDPGAQRRVADEGGDVERGAAPLQSRQVFREALEVPGHALAQHLQRHAFDVGQIAQGQIPVAGPAGRDGEAAVADHHGGDAEAGRGR